MVDRTTMIDLKQQIEALQHLKDTLLGQILAADTVESLEKLRVATLGKSGAISLMMKELGACAPEQRKEFGQILNTERQLLLEAFDSQAQKLEAENLKTRLEQEKVDVTLPPRPQPQGYIHPLSQTLYEVTRIFNKMGFQTAQGPHIETDFYNFTALNIPLEHPARQEHDTFYLNAKDEQGNRKVLRTHTSPVQIRAMLSSKPPIKIIAAGRTFRSDSDATHTPNFHQIEGLYIDKTVNMGNLKWCLLTFVREFFRKDDLELRFRSSYFPFTEPSAEVDIGYSRDKGELTLGGAANWLEILGCGMIHPEVLKHGGIDPQVYQGFAFGMGLERITMLKYGMPDLRAFYESDLRWLKHYGFKSFAALSEGVLS